MPECQEPGPLEDLRGTVKEYGRHVLACTGRRNWMPRVEEEDTLLGTVARDVNALADAVEPKPKLTALATAPTAGALDLIVYPERVRYRDVDAAAWARIRDGHLRDGRVVDALAPERLAGFDVLVCVHASRDARCGACGPLVHAAMTEEVRRRGLADVRVHMSSHQGGHKFAGNVIVYPAGEWYGYVRPPDVPRLVEARLVQDRTWEPHLRGVGGTRA